MTAKLLVRQGGGAAAEVDLANLGLPDREGVPFFDHNTSLITMGQRWEQGTAALGSFMYIDPHATHTHQFRPHASVKLVEDASGDDYIIAWNRIEGGNDTRRRSTTIGGDEVEHSSIGLGDCNLDLRGLPFATEWVRPAEDSWDRLQALAAAKLAGSSSTSTLHRATTNITVDRFTNGHLVDATSPVELEAKTYPVGTGVEEILMDILEEWGKGWGVTLHHTGGSTHKCLLVQDIDDLAKFTSDLRISDVPSDWDPLDLSAPTLEPNWKVGVGKLLENSHVISGLISIYGGTNDDPRHLYVETGEAPEDWEIWIDVYNDDLAKSETQAERRANNVLNDRKRPYTTNRPSILLLPEQVTLITAGQAIEVKSVVMNQGALKHEWVWRRIAQITWEPSVDGRWWAHLELDRPRGSKPRVGTSQPGSTSPEPPPPCAPAAGTTIVHDHIDPTNDTCFAGTYNTSDGDPFFDSFAPAKAISSTGYTTSCMDSGASHSLWDDLSPGETYGFSVDIADKGGVAAGKFFVIREFDAGDTLLATHSIPIGTRANYTKYTVSGEFGPLDANYDHAHFTWPTFYAKWYRNIEVSHTATPGEDDPDCFDYPAGTGPDSDATDNGFYLPPSVITAELDAIDERMDALARSHVESDIDPDASDDAYVIGTVWVNTTDDSIWVLTDDTAATAVWEQIDAGTASSGVRLQQVQTNQRFPVWGHRGDIGSADSLPENTLESVRQCALKGIQGAEVDVRLSSDGTFHLMHDSTVDRTTDGTGAISGKTDAAIAALNVNGGFGYLSGSYDVPTLASVFDALNPYDFVLSIQLNASSDANATALAELVVAADWTHRSLIEVATLSEAAAVKAVSTALTVQVNNGVSGADASADVDWLSMERATVTSLAVVTGKAPQHVKSYITIDDFPADETSIIQNMWDRGVAAYQTDNVDFALEARNGLVYGSTGAEPTADAHIADTTDAHDASAVSIADAGSYFTATEVEGALQELAADVATVSGHYEVIVSGTAPPVAVTNEAQDDWLYGFVP